MHLVQILVPLAGGDGRPLPPEAHASLRAELAERFGGVTAYARAPAVGLWKKEGEGADRDDIVVVEVMTPELDRAWWGAYRRTLEARFRQESVVVRATLIEML